MKKQEKNKQLRRQKLIEILANKYRTVRDMLPQEALNDAYGMSLNLDRPAINIHLALSMGMYHSSRCGSPEYRPQENILKVLDNSLYLREKSDSENRLGILKAVSDNFISSYVRYIPSKKEFEEKVEKRNLTKNEFKNLVQNMSYLIPHSIRDYSERDFVLDRYIMDYNKQIKLSSKKVKTVYPAKDLTEAQWGRYKQKNLNPENPNKYGVIRRLFSYFQRKAAEADKPLHLEGGILKWRNKKQKSPI